MAGGAGWFKRSIPFLAAGLATGITFLAWGRRSPKPSQAETDRLQALEAENTRLQAENQALAGRLSQLETELEKSRTSPWNWQTFWESVIRPNLWRVILTVGLVILGFIPVWTVMQERWFYASEVRDVLIEAWNKVAFLADTILPSYFLLVFAISLIIILLFLFFARPHFESLESKATVEEGIPPVPDLQNPPGSWQRRIGRICQWVAFAGIAGVVILNILNNTFPGAELAAVFLLYLGGRFIEEVPFDRIKPALDKIPAWVMAFCLAELALILLLQNVVEGCALMLGYIILMLITLGNLLRYWKKIPYMVWVFFLTQVIYTWKINSWQFSIIGDEYSFFGFANEIINNHSTGTILASLFDGTGVYGAHPYFSSLIQAASMSLFGQDSFGWRYSEVFVASASVIFFYLFLRRFVSERVSLLAVLLMAVSHYLVVFSKIGYNNLQALFTMTLSLWAASQAIHSRKPLAYTLLGLVVALNFYVYPAALYIIPLPFLLLLFYDPPTSKPALQRWLYCGTSFAILLLPLLFQPEYWSAKIPGTLFYRPAVTSSDNIGFHIFSNLIYALYSYLYLPEETHFVVSSYLDPLSGIFAPIGFAWVVSVLKRSRFQRFALLAFVLLILLVGVSHDRDTPSSTRMFMILPLFIYFAAVGIAWLAAEMQSWKISSQAVQNMVAGIVILCLALNLYQSYGLSRKRTLGVSALEVLFLRMLQRTERIDPRAHYYTYLFITEENWGIDGLRELQNAYKLPGSQSQLRRIVIDQPALPEDSIALIRQENSLVIVQPWMSPELIEGVYNQLEGIGKERCPIQDTPETNPQFILWHSPDSSDKICPYGGNWTGEAGLFSNP